MLSGFPLTLLLAIYQSLGIVDILKLEAYWKLPYSWVLALVMGTVLCAFGIRLLLIRFLNRPIFRYLVALLLCGLVTKSGVKWREYHIEIRKRAAFDLSEKKLRRETVQLLNVSLKSRNSMSAVLIPGTPNWLLTESLVVRPRSKSYKSGPVLLVSDALRRNSEVRDSTAKQLHSMPKFSNNENLEVYLSAPNVRLAAEVDGVKSHESGNNWEFEFDRLGRVVLLFIMN